MSRFKSSFLSYVMVLAGLVLLVGCTPEGPLPVNQSPVEKYGLLQIKNGKLSSAEQSQGAGNPVQLRGMSLFWSNWGAAWWNESAVDQAVDYLGCEIIRAPLAVGTQGPDPNDVNKKIPVDVVGGYLDAPEVNKARLKRVVDEAIYKGIYVIIDWHDHGAETHKDQAMAFFRDMATEYGNVPNVLFEIYNEPITTDWSGTIKPYAEEVIKAIRDTGAQNVIIVGTPYYSQQVDVAANDQIIDFPNIAYALHFYAGSHFLTSWQSTVLDPALAKGIAIVVTEWGVCQASGLDPSNLPNSDQWLAWMDTNQISWTNWELFDKQPPESASMFKAGTSPVGPWSDADLTDNSYFGNSPVSGVPMYYQGSGIYVKGKLPSRFTQLFVSPSLLTFNFRAGTQTTTVTNNAGTTWTATAISDGNWLRVTPATSNDLATYTTLEIEVDLHGGTTDRTGTIELTDTAGRKAKVLVIQQYNDGNIAKGQPTAASSLESPSYPAKCATDGDEANTRWSSLSSDPQWLCVDLADTYGITEVKLKWEAAYSSSYRIQLSSDTTIDDCSQGTWTDIYTSGSVPAGLGEHTDDLTITSTGSGRFIRVLSESRITSFGNSIWEFKVYAASSVSSLSVSPLTWSPSGSGDSTSISISSNVSWTAASSDTSWLAIVPPASGSGNGTLTVRANTNGTGATRSGSITITGDGGLTQTVVVTQDAAVGLVLMPVPAAVTVGAAEGSASVNVNSNTQWWDFTTDGGGWLALRTYSGSGNGAIDFSVSANTTGSARSATITIQGNGVSDQSVTVTQDP